MGGRAAYVLPHGHSYGEGGWSVSSVWCTCNGRHMAWRCWCGKTLYARNRDLNAGFVTAAPCRCGKTSNPNRGLRRATGNLNHMAAQRRQVKSRTTTLKRDSLKPLAWHGIDPLLIDPKESAMNSETQLRRRARAEGLTLTKYRETSRWYARYGPYSLADQSNCLVAYGLELDAVECELSGNRRG
jgi:hypothetical protein